MANKNKHHALSFAKPASVVLAEFYAKRDAERAAQARTEWQSHKAVEHALRNAQAEGQSPNSAPSS
jgi:hypothetical protein